MSFEKMLKVAGDIIRSKELMKNIFEASCDKGGFILKFYLLGHVVNDV